MNYHQSTLPFRFAIAIIFAATPEFSSANSLRLEFLIPFASRELLKLKRLVKRINGIKEQERKNRSRVPSLIKAPREGHPEDETFVRT